ncbi:MAG: hypothetical protein ACU0DW_08570, partial [Shimia sp.]
QAEISVSRQQHPRIIAANTRDRQGIASNRAHLEEAPIRAPIFIDFSHLPPKPTHRRNIQKGGDPVSKKVLEKWAGTAGALFV